MYITGIEIDNFKSFAKKTKIPFLEGFTVVSGPNGSGKSNIIDSLLFALALSNSRGLRAEKLTDLINLNSGKNTAEVAITFSDGTEIRRRIKRTASNYYSYNYLNGKLVKQNDIVDFLAKFGVTPEGYNVVMQGDITRIMEMSDFERRKIVDEIAGVSEFEGKKARALDELEVVRERIEREEVVLFELNARIEELKHEREQALAYRHWQEELEHFKSCRAAAQVRDMEKEHASILSSITETGTDLERTLSDLGIEQNDLEYLRGDLRDVDAEINEKSGSEYLKMISALEGAKGRIKVAEGTIARLKKEKEGNLEGVNRAFLDEKRASERVQECTAQVRTLSVDRANLSMELAGVQATVGNLEAEIARGGKAAEGLKERLLSLIGEVEEKKGTRSEYLHRQDLLIEKSRMRTSEMDRLQGRLTEVQSGGESLAVEIEKAQRASAELVEKKGALDRDLSKAESTLFARRSSLERIRREVQDTERELMRLEAQQQSRGGVGGPALEAVLGMDGVCGTVAQLGKTPPEYATALDVAAGGKLRYVVAESDSVAAEAIRYLKEQRLGRLTFLPMNKLRGKEYPLVREPGVIGYAKDLLSFNSEYDLAFQQVFGSTLVVDTLECARRLMGRYRMVTLEGELLERSGAMTGGYLKKQQQGGFGAAVEDEIARLSASLAEKREEIAEFEHSVACLTSEAEELRKRRSGIEQDAARYAMVIEEYERRITSQQSDEVELTASLATLKAEVEESAGELASVEAALDGVGDALAVLNREVAALKQKLDDTEIPRLTEEFEQKRRECEGIERRLRNKEADIADAQRERQYFERRVEELGAERERLADKNAGIDVEVSGAEAEIVSARAEIAGLEERQKAFSSELDGLRRKREEIAESIVEAEKRCAGLNAKSDRVRLQIASLKEKAAELAVEIEGLREHAGEETDLSLSEIEGGIAEAERNVRSLGAVNMLAIDEYGRVCDRIEERTKKKDVLSAERTSILERIEHFDTLKYDSFMEAFRAIDANFREIFARLTAGSGNLALENPDDPFSGGLTFAVQPRGKKVQLLSALSGGEKSLTTLAFLFSIQKYMPAPFYAFDEVDMFLDGSNVEQVAAMIRELSGRAQFISVSLRKPMIERADRIMGVTIRPDKSTLVTGVENHA
ncbi:chromosome segregation protein SMC [Methanofollis aquaemaris]|uniref:Chromosome partition protein Smc n=1 Tax=Methanofollis aquaemaris TaxID=126734 RepID=A0A8A3S6Q2_9EURY|nr:chromosome segregation protein SMC [Methanofollis aquaemaris]QSZ67722.1 chromosome segregation protein SMC [Methanofollis aquaemaris]